MLQAAILVRKRHTLHVSQLHQASQPTFRAYGVPRLGTIIEVKVCCHLGSKFLPHIAELFRSLPGRAAGSDSLILPVVLGGFLRVGTTDWLVREVRGFKKARAMEKN